MTNGLQTFLRMANLYNPQQMSNDMPTELPVNKPMRPPPIQDDSGNQITPDEEVVAQAEEPTSTLDLFRQNVLNPPQRTQMTYPKNTLAGLDAALKIAAEPSPLEKNRVYVNGQAYQKQQVYTDPKTGERKFITNVHEPSFASQVMRAMPAAVSPAVDILNQPYTDAISDWEMKNKGLASAVNAETQMALAQQRQAQAGAIPVTAEARQTTANAAMMNAQTRKRLAELNTLTDEDKILLLQQGRITLQEIQDAAAMDRLERGGQIRSGQIEQQGKIRSGQIAQQGSLSQELARIRAEEARKTKATAPGGASVTSQLPTQQRVALQAKAQEVVNQNPEWADYITFNEQGFPVITMPDTSWGPGTDPKDIQTYNQIYEAIYGTARPEPATPQATKPSVKPAAKPAPKKQSGPTGPPPAGYVYVEDINGNFVGQVKNDENLKRLNTAKYRVRK